MFCRKCGKEINENSIVCEYCGCNVITIENEGASEKEKSYIESTVIENDIGNNKVEPKKKIAFKRIIIGLLGLVLLCMMILAVIHFWPPKITTYDIDSIKGSPEFYDIKFGMDVNEAGKNIVLKHRCIEGMEDSVIFDVSEFNKTSHIIIEEGEVFSLYKKKANDVYVSFDEKTVDGVMLLFSKDDYPLNSIVSLYEKIYGTPSNKSSSGATWTGKYTTIDVIDWSQIPDEDDENDNNIVVRYLQTENSQYTNIAFDNNGIDICGFLDKNYIFDKSPSYFIKDLKEGDDYNVESFSPEGFSGFSKYTLYPRFKYFNIEKGYTAIEFTTPSDSDVIDSFSYLFLLDNEQASVKVKEIVEALKDEYGDNDKCDYTSIKYSKMGIDSISHSEMINRISSNTEGMYFIQWKTEKELITFNITIDPLETYYEGEVAFSKQ